jgi:hypothetical protein
MTGDQMQRLKEAVLLAYDEDQLQQLVHFTLGKDLFTLVKPGAFNGVVFRLLRWAEMEGDPTLRKLVEAIKADRPGRPDVQAIANDLLKGQDATCQEAFDRYRKHVREGFQFHSEETPPSK